MSREAEYVCAYSHKRPRVRESNQDLVEDYRELSGLHDPFPRTRPFPDTPTT
jgi:hypothetical protein